MTSNCSSFVHNIQIATPCKADWNTMSGDEQKRFCGMCNKNVYNIAEMALADVEKLIIESEGKVCVRFYRRKDGTVITQDCPVGIRQKLIKRVTTGCAFVTGVAAIVVAWVTNSPRPAATPRPGGYIEIVNTTSTGRPEMGNVVAQPQPLTGSLEPLKVKGSHHYPDQLR